MNGPSSIPSGCRFPQTKVDRTPRYDNRKPRKMLHRKLKSGRPRNQDARQHWVK